MTEASACPVCRQRGPWAKSPTAPFCSPRCRQVDLGRWFGGGYAISEPLRPEHFEDESLPMDSAEPESDDESN